ncbi:MAG: helix-turn-helix domain-containing protein [Planctomycetota bacterium]
MPTNSQYGLFVKLDCIVLERSDLNSTAKLVYAVIVDCIRDNAVGWPGIRYFAKRIGVSEKPVVKAIKTLKKFGLLEVKCDGRGKRSYYCVPTECGRESNTSTVGQSPDGVGEMTSQPWEKLPMKQTKEADSNKQTEALPVNEHVARVLERLGIEEPTRTQLIHEHPGVTVRLVETVLSELKPNAKPGLKIDQLRKKLPVLLTEQRDRNRLSRELDVILSASQEAHDKTNVGAHVRLEFWQLNNLFDDVVPILVRRLGGSEAARAVTSERFKKFRDQPQTVETQSKYVGALCFIIGQK